MPLVVVVKMPTFPAETKKSDTGYTLLELLVVVAVISMAIALAPNVYARLVPSFQVRQFSNDIINEARSLRQRAVDERMITWLAVRENDNTLHLSNGFLAMPGGVELAFSDEKAIEPNKDGTIYFYPNGMSSGGEVIVQKDTYEAVIAVDWISGAIGLVS